MISILIDETLLYQLILLFIIIFLGKVLYLNPIKEVIDRREEKLKNLTSGAESSLNSVAQSKQAYEEKLANAKREISSYQMQMKDETSKEIDKIISEAKAKIAQQTEASRKDLEVAITEARSGLQDEVKEISNMIYKTITGKVV